MATLAKASARPFSARSMCPRLSSSKVAAITLAFSYNGRIFGLDTCMKGITQQRSTTRARGDDNTPYNKTLPLRHFDLCCDSIFWGPAGNKIKTALPPSSIIHAAQVMIASTAHVCTIVGVGTSIQQQFRTHTNMRESVCAAGMQRCSYSSFVGGCTTTAVTGLYNRTPNLCRHCPPNSNTNVFR